MHSAHLNSIEVAVHGLADPVSRKLRVNLLVAGHWSLGRGLESALARTGRPGCHSA